MMIERVRFALPCLFAALAGGCADSTEPVVLPADGDYVLVAGGGADPFEDEWSTLPFEYDIVGDSSCVFRLVGGAIAITGRTYSADLQQEVVSCEAGHEPLAQEAGQLARVFEGNRFNGQFAFIADQGTSGWLNFAQVIEGEFLVALVPPIDSGAVHWLRFQRR